VRTQKVKEYTVPELLSPNCSGGKVLGGVETKTGNSPYKPSQRAKDEYLKQTGYPVNLVRKPKDPPNQ
jgi:hypothetical protein